MCTQQKGKEVSYDVGVQIILGCHCEFWSKRQISEVVQSVQNRWPDRAV
jgi:hypothetical protein